MLYKVFLKTIPLFIFLFSTQVIKAQVENEFHKKQLEQEFKMWKKDAKHGDASAQTMLGYYYLEGKGTLADTAEAFKWFTKAASHETNGIANFNLGEFYTKGIGVQKDVELAIHFYTIAGTMGYLGGYSSVARIYRYGSGNIKVDKLEAVKWYQKDANGLGKIGLIGLAETVKFMKLKEDALLGNASSQALLGQVFKNGNADIAKDTAEAFKWFTMAANQGNPVGEYELGESFEFGLGVKEDKAEAKKWYQKVMEQGASPDKKRAEIAIERMNPQNDFWTFKNTAANKVINGLKQGNWLECLDQNYSVTKKDSARFLQNTVYQNSKVFGIQKIYNLNGVLIKEIPYKNGRKNGVAKSYFKSGILKNETTYVDDSLTGVAKEYYENRQLAEEKTMLNGKNDGSCKIYRNNGLLEKEINFKNGKQNGLMKVYYENGHPQIEMTWKNGIVNGITKVYNENGNLSSEITYLYLNSKVETEQTSYYPTGELMSKSHYIDGIENGDRISYYENGNIQSELKRINGKSEGISKYYFPGGQLQQETPYVNGKRNGIAKQYKENGELAAEIPYQDGEQSGKVDLKDKVQRDNFLSGLKIFLSIATNAAKQYQASTTDPNNRTQITKDFYKHAEEIEQMKNNSGSARTNNYSTSTINSSPEIHLQSQSNVNSTASNTKEKELSNANNISTSSNDKNTNLTITERDNNTDLPTTKEKSTCTRCESEGCVGVKFKWSDDGWYHSEVTNTTNTIVTYKLCVLRTDGIWDCITDNIKPFGTDKSYFTTAAKSGQYKLYAAYGDWVNQTCNFPNPN